MVLIGVANVDPETDAVTGATTGGRNENVYHVYK
jgi:hypothetical protein